MFGLGLSKLPRFIGGMKYIRYLKIGGRAAKQAELAHERLVVRFDSKLDI